MIELYQFSSSPFCAKVRRALNFKGIDFELHEVDRMKARKGAYAHVSEFGKFPALGMDGKYIADSSHILQALDVYQAEKPLYPKEDRALAQVNLLEDWADESLYFYEMLMRIRWENNLPRSWPSIKATLPKLPDFVLKRMVRKGIAAVTDAQGVGRKSKEQIIQDSRRHFHSIDNFLDDSGWLVGDSLTAADISVVVQLEKILYASEAQEILKTTKNIEPWLMRLNEVAPD